MPAHATTWLAYVRQLPGRRPLLVDVVLAGATTAVSLALASHPPAGSPDADATGLGLTCLLGGLLLARQRAPLVVLGLYCAIWFSYIHAGYWPVANSPGLLLALYTVAARRQVRIAALCAIPAVGVWVYAGRDSALLAALQGMVWTAVLIWFGHSAQQLAVRNAELTRLAVRLQLEQEDRARRAVVDERVRIARELHDVVAHHISVISVQAGLARYVLVSDPETARTALSTVLSAGGEALEEMRRVLVLLRFGPDEPESYTPTPGLGHLDGLADRVRAAGVPVEVVITGETRPLPPGADLCAYRVIQESLTNVLKHAGPARVTITLRYERDRLIAQVRDDGRTEPPAGDIRWGHGLIGMRERAQLYGGTLVAGHRPAGGYQVVLTLPTSSIMEGMHPGGGSDM